MCLVLLLKLPFPVPVAANDRIFCICLLSVVRLCGEYLLAQ